MGFIKAEIVGQPLKEMSERVSPRNMGRVLRTAIKAWAAVIDQDEFGGRQWLMPGGGTQRWKDVPAFGNVPANPTPLQRTGRLRAAYKSAAAGGGTISATTEGGKVELHVNVPGGYAAVHRGGTGKLLSGDIVPLAIPVTDKMRWFLGLSKGVWLKRSTKSILIPRRPHATSNPKIRGQLRYLFARWAAGKQLPNYGGTA